MKKIVMVLGVSFLMAASAVSQTPAAAPPAAAASTSPVAKQPQMKSAAEQAAWEAFVGAQADPAAMIKAGNAFVAAHPMSDFKPIVYQVMASVYFQTRDFDNAVIAADKAIAADPQSYAAMLIVASSLAESTKEFDLDKAEKLARVEKMASQALETLTASPRPRPDITDEMWAAARRDIGSQAFEARAIAARVDKKYDAAIAAFKRYAADTAQPEPRTMLMFSETYFAVKQWDNGIALLDPLIASPQMHPQIKKAAEDLKAQALKLKASAK